ncbi:DUF7324 family protein [Bradyrhizobium viridifuturi]|uniref:DUF7324 family protein n=1 Tax=Bradyrhizobium viridifuturi TaxID=1654716 RepID=UPI003D3189CD
MMRFGDLRLRPWAAFPQDRMLTNGTAVRRVGTFTDHSIDDRCRCNGRHAGRSAPARRPAVAQGGAVSSAASGLRCSLSRHPAFALSA